jgi:hypothetical protein
VDVVAVEVDLVGGIALDGQIDGAALLEGDVLDAADGLGVLHDDRRRPGVLGRVRRAAGADDHDRDDEDDERQPKHDEPLIARHMNLRGIAR